MADKKRAQVKVRKGNIVMGHSAGTILWLDAELAQKLVDAKAVDIIGADFKLGPTETKEDSEGKKSFDARTSGPSTDSASSNPDGGASRLSASEEVQASLENRSRESGGPESATSVESSRSTTPTRSRRGRT